MKVCNKHDKVMFVLPSLQFGGAEKKVVDFILRMDKIKYHPIVCTFIKGGTFEDILKRKGIKIYTLQRKFKYDISLITRLIKIIKKEKIQIVQTTLIIANLYGRIAAILSRVPIIIATEHSMGTWRMGKHTIINRFLCHFTDKIIVVAKAQKIFLQETEYILSDKMIVIYNGVDLKKFNVNYNAKRKRRKFGFREKRKIVGTVGTLRYPKGHHIFLKAASKIVKNYPYVDFIIVGDGPRRKELETLTLDLGLSDSIIFLGNRNDIPEILPIFDIFVLPSDEETFPNVILEAMATGKPVVSTNVGGLGEIVVDSKTGFLVPKANVNALADAVSKLLTDRKLAQKMGRAGRKRVEKYFSMEKMVKERERLFRDLLKQKGLTK